MTLQPITHRDRLVAVASRSRFFLADHLDGRPPHDAERTFAVYMCAYAGDILNGRLPGPYSDDDACRFARACLIPGELVERAELDIDRAAAGIGVPADELAIAHGQARCSHGRPMGGNAPR